MQHGRSHSFLLLIFTLTSAAVFADTSSQPSLRVAWPSHWEYRPPQRQGPAVHLQAREQRDGITLQKLDLTVIDTSSAQKPITSESIKELASKLRDASLSTSVEKTLPLREFPNHRGYYFVASDVRFVGAKANSFRQMIEGVLLDQGYFINFTLLTNDAGSADTQKIVDALSESKLSPPANAAQSVGNIKVSEH